MNRMSIFVAAACAMTTGAALAQSTPADGSVLPFPAPPMAGVTKQRMWDSIMKWPAATQ